MHLGSIYLVVQDFEKSLLFYEKLLGILVTRRNKDRFAQFIFDGSNISIMNGYFDKNHPEQVTRKGQFVSEFDDMDKIAQADNTHKFVLNFWVEDLQLEYQKQLEMNLSDKLTRIRYINAGIPYYYFSMTDPDGNIIEVTGNYTPEEAEL